MKLGDLVKTTGFGPHGRLGEIGLVVRQWARIRKCWEVLFFEHSNGGIHVFPEDGLEAMNESR